MKPSDSAHPLFSPDVLILLRHPLWWFQCWLLAHLILGSPKHSAPKNDNRSLPPPLAYLRDSPGFLGVCLSPKNNIGADVTNNGLWTSGTCSCSSKRAQSKSQPHPVWITNNYKAEDKPGRPWLALSICMWLLQYLEGHSHIQYSHDILWPA